MERFLIYYVLNIIDANVDAHLMTFDVSDDLSMNIIPQISIIEKTQYAGLALTLSF